ncbi:MAG TPA: hypothetical protein VGB68_04850, partial [Pyrinomonadaceae bacterium]
WLIVNSQLLILNYLTKDTEHQFRIYNLEFTIFPFFIFVQSPKKTKGEEIFTFAFLTFHS